MKESLEPRNVVTALALALFTYWVFAGVSAFEFVSFDDPSYVVANEHVRSGLNRESIAWAFGLHATAGNWHPLTWLSHMLDMQLFGLEAGAHHRTSAILHGANAGLCFLALSALTRAFWSSFLVAALFALHPLRAESVAWVSERKDVLCAFFAFVTLWAYAAWTRRRGAWRYVLLLLGFGLGLLAKPMLVSLPCVLLLLDAWPLGRTRLRATDATGAAGPPAAADEPRATTHWRLVREKLPLFALSLASMAVTLYAQSEAGAVRTTGELALSERLLHVPIAYERYVVQSFWPSGLACFYPHPAVVAPETLSAVSPAFWRAVVFSSALSLACVLLWRRAPSLAVGWLWFVGMLVPVIGLVQVGGQAVADRYTYLPGIGLAIALVFGLRDLFAARVAPSSNDGIRRGWVGRALMTIAAISLLAVLVSMTRRQCATWKDSEALFSHALEVTQSNYKAHNSLGVVLEQKGEIELAREHYEAALAIQPRHAQALTNLGLYHHRRGESDLAQELYQQALASDPRLVSALGNLGALHLQRGEMEQGMALLERALEVKEDQAGIHFNLGLVLRRQGRQEEGLRHFERAAELDPQYAGRF